MVGRSIVVSYLVTLTLNMIVALTLNLVNIIIVLNSPPPVLTLPIITMTFT